VRYLVTGATGFIGRHLVRHLGELGHEVTALVRTESAGLVDVQRRPGVRRSPDAEWLPGVRLVHGDLASGSGLLTAVQEAAPDLVIHLAGVTKAVHPRTYYEINADGTRRLRSALAALPHPARLVYCSSLSASGPGRGRHEDDPPAPVSAYGRSKLGGEQAVGDLGVVVRPPIVYGPGDREFLPRMVTAVRAGMLPVVGRPGPRHYSLIHVDDLCRALLTAAEHGADGAVHHVSDGTEHRWEDIGAAVATALGRRPPRVVRVPGWAATAAARALGRGTTLTPDKVTEALHPAWTTAPGRLPFVARIALADGLREALRP
jgi:nucleoside-diphosphate-sugar epimerase